LKCADFACLTLGPKVQVNGKATCSPPRHRQMEKTKKFGAEGRKRNSYRAYHRKKERVEKGVGKERQNSHMKAKGTACILPRGKPLKGETPEEEC